MDEAFAAFEELSVFLGEKVEGSEEEETLRYWSCHSLSPPYKPAPQYLADIWFSPTP